ncbi:MAG TPA: hypothetical protein VGH49_18070 [Xanthobacteraceae bacterium]
MTDQPGNSAIQSAQTGSPPPTAVEIKEKLRDLEGRRQWYQHVEIDGVASPGNANWVESRFYNRGKWENFILPLMPAAAGTFAELGANAGLFLLYAADLGFERVIGIEGDDTWFAQARYVIDHYGSRAPETYGRIDLLHARIGEPWRGANIACNIRTTCGELDLAALPPVDIMLMANVLYWIERRACLDFIDRLAEQARYAIVVSVEWPSPDGGPATIAEVRKTFSKRWIERGCVPGIDAELDSAPRNMFSVLFESRG